MKRIIRARAAQQLGYGLFTAIAILGFVTVASADPPARVGRLNFMEGSVSFRPAGVEDWSSASINYPVTVGDRVWTDSGSRVELHIGSTAVRLGPQTDFDVLNLSDGATQLSLSQGSIVVHVNRLDDDDVFEVDTPNAAVSLLRPGFYRIDVSGEGDDTYVTVRRGQAEVTAEGNAFSVDPNQSATVAGTDSVSYDIEAASPFDRWDDWCLARDRREAQLAAQAARDRYISEEMTGYEDLNGYGAWRVVPDYGNVWVPTRVAAGWAPYRYGHWAWVYPWGWTWVDDAPWGFAPFHYGRWAYVGGGWAWVPGTYIARPVYAPALVAFVGGGGLSLSVFGGGGGVAWFPLGPREVFVPAYRVSPVYVRNVNVTNVNVTNINVTNINVTNVNYVNRRVAGAVTAVPQTAFVGGRHVATAAVQVRQSDIATATVTGTTAMVVPTRASLSAQQTAGATVALPPQKALKRGIVAKSTVPPPPVAFSAQVQAMKQPGAPPDPESLKAYRKQQKAEERSVKLATVQTGTLKPKREGITLARPVTADSGNPTGKKPKGDTGAQQGGGSASQQTPDSGTGHKNKNKDVTSTGQPTGSPTGQTGQPDTGVKHKDKQVTDSRQPTGNPPGQTGQPDTGGKQKSKQVTDSGQPAGNPTGQTGQPDTGEKHKNKQVTDSGQPTSNPSGQTGQPDAGAKHKNKQATDSGQPAGNPSGKPAGSGAGQPGGKVKQKDKVDETKPEKNKKPKDEKEKNPQ